MAANLINDLDEFFHAGWQQAIRDSIECLKKWQAFDDESEDECPPTIGDLLGIAEDAIESIPRDTEQYLTAKGRQECLSRICASYPDCDDIAMIELLESFLSESHLIEVDGGSFTLFCKKSGSENRIASRKN